MSAITKPKPISGFPEWLPEIRRVEQQWLDHIRCVFESYGFCSIETPSVEALEIINAKGGDGGADVDKEVYVIERLHKEEGDKEARLALHFDQTVPLARYVAQHFNDLDFPFKRYQMQKVWRGERPQAGRFREFVQCDIDVINVDHLPLHFDAEMPAIIWKILSSLPGMEKENFQIRISNRKILIGLCETLGIENVTDVTRAIDKRDKIAEDAVAELLKSYGLNDRNIASLLELANIKVQKSTEFAGFLHDFIVRNDVIARSKCDSAIQLMQDGVAELDFTIQQLSHLPEGAVVADLSIVRGLDYYTGTVYETVFTDDPGYGSICSGGRYDDLASHYINKKLPGVGISIGFSRLFDRLRQNGAFDSIATRKCPTDVLVLLLGDDQRDIMNQTAQILRGRGFNVETAHGGKLKRQLAYAEKKGIPYVWFPADGEVKNMTTGEQTLATPNDWTAE